MADTLTQEQIDALLNSAFSGEEIAPVKERAADIKEYDFRAPKKFTKERIKVIDNIFDNYSRLLSSYLTGLLRLYCKVSLAAIEEQRYFEFNNALPDYVMMGIVDLTINDDEVDDLTTILQLSNSLTFIMIDRLLGGRGEYKDSERDFTEIEISIMQGVLRSMAALLREPWETYVEMKPVLGDIETNSRVISAVGYDDTMVICVLEVIVSDTKTLVSVCMPALELEEVMNKFTQKAGRTAKRTDATKDKERKDNIMDSVAHSDLSVTAVLGEVKLDMYDILNLQVDDIIPLGKSIDSNVAIRIGGKKWFDGKIGTSGGKKAVKIDNIFGNEFL